MCLVFCLLSFLFNEAGTNQSHCSELAREVAEEGGAPLRPSPPSLHLCSSPVLLQQWASSGGAWPKAACTPLQPSPRAEPPRCSSLPLQRCPGSSKRRTGCSRATPHLLVNTQDGWKVEIIFFLSLSKPVHSISWIYVVNCDCMRANTGQFFPTLLATVSTCLGATGPMPAQHKTNVNPGFTNTLFIDMGGFTLYSAITWYYLYGYPGSRNLFWCMYIPCQTSARNGLDYGMGASLLELRSETAAFQLVGAEPAETRWGEGFGPPPASEEERTPQSLRPSPSAAEGRRRCTGQNLGALPPIDCWFDWFDWFDSYSIPPIDSRPRQFAPKALASVSKGAPSMEWRDKQ